MYYGLMVRDRAYVAIVKESILAFKSHEHH